MMNVNIRYLWLATALSALIPALSVSVPVLGSTNDTLSITGNAKTVAMPLKATKEGGETNTVDGFKLTADNVLQIEEGQTVRITNDEEFTRALTIDVNDNKKKIDISDNGEVSFNGYSQGTYLLDVVVDDEKAYECIIVIGPEDNDTVNKVIKKSSEKTFIDITIVIIFEEPIDGECSEEEGSAGLSYPYDKKSECEYEEYLQCEEDELNGLPETDRCDELDEGFFDDCQGFPNAEECNRYFENPDCYDDPYSQQCIDYCSQNPGATGCPIEDIPIVPLDQLTPTPTPEPTPTPTPEPTPTPTPTPNALARGLLPTTPIMPTNPCEAIPEPDLPECKDLPAETPEPTPLPPTPETLIPTEEIEGIPNIPLEDTEEEEVEEEEPEEPEEEEPEVEEEETTEEESDSEGTDSGVN